MQDRTPGPPNEGNPIPAFMPVPRICKRHDGWTPQRQIAFIDALADTGSVRAAARRVNMSSEGAYFLRRQAGAEEFRDAWDAALNFGIQTLTDLAVDRIKHGTPVPIFWKGEQVGERRWYNDKLLMFILKHHQPHIYNPPQLKTGTKHLETLKREWEQEQALERRREGNAATMHWLRQMDVARGRLLRQLAESPETRSAWELIVGPTDWHRVVASQQGDPTEFIINNTNFPSTQVLLLQRVEGTDDTVQDYLFGDFADDPDGPKLEDYF